jgi:SAM-dependent methyltransferase
MNGQEQVPSYGVIDQYLDEKGKKYFEWQGALKTQGQFNLHFWRSHIATTDEVLDFGCGGGFLLRNLQAERKVGVEINPHARAFGHSQGTEIVPTVEDAGGQFDKILSSHTLEHVPHPRQAILALKSRLRDTDSRLVLLLPLDDWRSRSQRNYRPCDSNMHLHTWTPQLLGNLLESSGLKVLDLKLVHHAWPPKPELLWGISPRLFHLAAFCWSVLRKQRQILAIAGLPS